MCRIQDLVPIGFLFGCSRQLLLLISTLRLFNCEVLHLVKHCTLSGTCSRPAYNNWILCYDQVVYGKV